MYASQEQKSARQCGLCGRSLGVGFYYMCHVCGATYCYAHSPQKCDHNRGAVPPLRLTSTSKS